jgi:hypothetical protein
MAAVRENACQLESRLHYSTSVDLVEFSEYVNAKIYRGHVLIEPH